MKFILNHQQQDLTPIAPYSKMVRQALMSYFNL